MENIDVNGVSINDTKAILRVVSMMKFLKTKNNEDILIGIKDNNNVIHHCYAEERDGEEKVIHLIDHKTKMPFLCLSYKDMVDAIAAFCCEFIEVEARNNGF